MIAQDFVSTYIIDMQGTASKNNGAPKHSCCPFILSTYTNNVTDDQDFFGSELCSCYFFLGYPAPLATTPSTKS